MEVRMHRLLRRPPGRLIDAPGIAAEIQSLESTPLSPMRNYSPNTNATLLPYHPLSPAECNSFPITSDVQLLPYHQQYGALTCHQS